MNVDRSGCAGAATVHARLDPAAYERHRRREVAYGRWQPRAYIDPATVRDHVLRLRRDGVGRDTVARLARVSTSTLYRIANGLTPAVAADVAARILGVTPDDGVFVDAVGAQRRLQALIAIGHTQVRLAAAIGWQVQNLNRIVTGKHRSISRASHGTICDLYDRLSTTSGGDTYGARRARQLAARQGWGPPLAWDDDALDDPDGRPNLGDDSDELVDEVLAERVAHGQRPYADLHNRAEQIAAWHAWMRRRQRAGLLGTGVTEFAVMAGISTTSASTLRFNAEGKNARGSTTPNQAAA